MPKKFSFSQIQNAVRAYLFQGSLAISAVRLRHASFPRGFCAAGGGRRTFELIQAKTTPEKKTRPRSQNGRNITPTLKVEGGNKHIPKCT